MHQIRLFFTALQFFTRLPIPRWVGFEPLWLNQASRYFPLVGVVPPPKPSHMSAKPSSWKAPVT